MKKVSKNVARDQLLAAQNAKEMQLQKKKIREALKKLASLGNVQFSKLKENVEAIMNEVGTCIFLDKGETNKNNGHFE